MILICESNSPKDYLMKTEKLTFSHLSIREKVSVLYSKSSSNEVDFVKKAYNLFVMKISHSWDISKFKRNM